QGARDGVSLLDAELEGAASRAAFPGDRQVEGPAADDDLERNVQPGSGVPRHRAGGAERGDRRSRRDLELAKLPARIGARARLEVELFEAEDVERRAVRRDGRRPVGAGGPVRLDRPGPAQGPAAALAGIVDREIARRRRPAGGAVGRDKAEADGG